MSAFFLVVWQRVAPVLHRIRYYLWGALALAGMALAFVIAFRRDEEGKFVIPDPPTKLKEKVDRAEEDALRAKVAAKAKADEQRAQLDQVGQIEDGAERRKRLAEMLRTM